MKVPLRCVARPSVHLRSNRRREFGGIRTPKPPTVGPAGWISVGPGAGDWSITVSPISALPALPETGGYDAYLYAGAEQPAIFSSAHHGRVNIRQFNGVDPTDSILPQEDFTAVGILLAGPSVVNVQLESVSPWTRTTN